MLEANYVAYLLNKSPKRMKKESQKYQSSFIMVLKFYDEKCKVQGRKILCRLYINLSYKV